MLESIIEMFGFPEQYEFLAYWISALVACFVFINLLSILSGIFKSVGGFK